MNLTPYPTSYNPASINRQQTQPLAQPGMQGMSVTGAVPSYGNSSVSQNPSNVINPSSMPQQQASSDPLHPSNMNTLVQALAGPQGNTPSLAVM